MAPYIGDNNYSMLPPLDLSHGICHDPHVKPDFRTLHSTLVLGSAITEPRVHIANGHSVMFTALFITAAQTSYAVRDAIIT